MPMEEEPVIGAMYEDEDGLAFEVVSFDEDEGIIEVQYEDGEVSEIDIDSDQPGHFTPDDRTMLEEIARVVVDRLTALQ